MLPKRPIGRENSWPTSSRIHLYRLSLIRDAASDPTGTNLGFRKVRSTDYATRPAAFKVKDSRLAAPGWDLRTRMWVSIVRPISDPKGPGEI